MNYSTISLSSQEALWNSDVHSHNFLDNVLNHYPIKITNKHELTSNLITVVKEASKLNTAPSNSDKVILSDNK